MDTAERLLTFADGDERIEISDNGFQANSNTDLTTDTHEETRRSTRKRTETERMKQYNLQLLERDFVAAQRACTR